MPCHAIQEEYQQFAVSKTNKNEKENKTHENDTHTFCTSKKKEKKRSTKMKKREENEERSMTSANCVCQNEFRSSFTTRRAFSVRFSAEIRLFIG